MPISTPSAGAVVDHVPIFTPASVPPPPPAPWSPERAKRVWVLPVKDPLLTKWATSTTRKVVLSVTRATLNTAKFSAFWVRCRVTCPFTELVLSSQVRMKGETSGFPAAAELSEKAI